MIGGCDVSSHVRVFSALLGFVVGLAATARAARVIEVYDLDSLVHLSQLIIQCEVGDSRGAMTRNGDVTVHDVRVTRVFQGNANVGQTLAVVGLDEYHYAPGLLGRRDWRGPIGKGETVVLFLVSRDARMGYSKYSLAPADWKIVPSGVRLIRDLRVHAYSQYWPKRMAIGPAPGYTAVTPITYPDQPIVLRAEFERDLQSAIGNEPAFRKLLEDQPAPEQLDHLIALLRERIEKSKKSGARNDPISDGMAGKIAQIAEPKLLDELRREMGYFARSSFDYTLQSARGRPYLLDRVADPFQPYDRRVEWARLLSDSGWPYYRECRDSAGGKGQAVETDFATRLAKLAVANAGAEIGDLLLEGVRSCAVPEPPGRARLELLAKDLDSALQVLAAAYKDADPPTRYWIVEVAARIAPEAAQRLAPDVGGLLTLVQPETPAIDTKRRLHFRGRWRDTMKKTDPPARTVLVLKSLADHREIELPAGAGIAKHRGESDSFGTSSLLVALPQDLPQGAFSVFMRTYLQDKPAGDGFGFEIDLPVAEPRR